VGVGKDRSFRVGVRAGHRALGWPLCRLTVGSTCLRLTSWPSFWIRERVVDREDVVCATLGYRFRVAVLRIQDSRGTFRSTSIELPVGATKVANMLRSWGTASKTSVARATTSIEQSRRSLDGRSEPRP